MPYPAPYSVRFANRRGPSAAWEYVVPDDKRAVMRWIGMTAFTPAGASVFLFCNGAVPLYWLTERVNDRAFWEVRIVAYPGDVFTFQTAGSDIALHASGFLFGDDGSGGQPGAAAEAGRLPAMPALPGLDFEG
jgi:hypothetical protein